MEKAETIEKLKESPLFNLSLASKELFHSNFLCWLGENEPKSFYKILNTLLGKANTINWDSLDKLKIEREFKNYDICIKSDEQILLIIENKVKSIPDRSQLCRYKEANSDEVKYILLSLMEKFPDKEKIKDDGWIIVSYNELSDAIKKQFNYKNILYHKFLIDDYCSFISDLHAIQENWHIGPDVRYFYDTIDEKTIRIHDLCEKNRYTQMLAMLNEELLNLNKCEMAIGIPIETAIGIPIKEIEKEINATKDIINKIYLNSGLTHTTCFIEAKLVLDKNTIMVIQIQGEHYRHAIEVFSTARANEIKNGKDKDLNSLNYFNDKWKNANNNILENEIYPKPDKKGKFNKYGDLFFYQSRKIKKEVSVKGLLSLIKEEIKTILELKHNK